MRACTVDPTPAPPASRPARSGATRPRPWRRHGLAALHGSSPDVGIVGYSLGGGIGWYARKLGLAANSVTAVELVTADGELVRADATQNRDLFWALRGGGGNFGVVTALEFHLYPIETAYAGCYLGPHHGRAGAAPLGRLGGRRPRRGDHLVPLPRPPPLPAIPEPLRGRRLVVIDGAVLGCDAAASDPGRCAAWAPRSTPSTGCRAPS